MVTGPAPCVMVSPCKAIAGGKAGGVFFVSLSSSGGEFEGFCAGGSPAGVRVGLKAGDGAGDTALSAGSFESLGSPDSPVDGSLGLDCELSLLEPPDPADEGFLAFEGGSLSFESPGSFVDGSSGLGCVFWLLDPADDGSLGFKGGLASLESPGSFVDESFGSEGEIDFLGSPEAPVGGSSGLGVLFVFGLGSAG